MMRLIFFCLLALTLGACSSKGPRSDAPADTVFSTDFRILQGRYFADGQKMYLLLESKSYRPTIQIYEVPLFSRKARQISWQHGAIQSFDVSSMELAYASTTDEIKERPHTSEQVVGLGRPLEVYTRSLSTDEIRRWTQRPGFDADVSLSANELEIAYVSREKDHWRLYRQVRNGRTGAQMFRRSTQEIRWPSIQHGRDIAWIEHGESNAKVICRHGNRTYATSTFDGGLIYLTQAPSAGWLTITRSSATTTDMIYIAPRCACTRVMHTVTHPATWVDATDSPPRLFYSETSGGQNHVVVKTLPEDAFSCVPPEPAAK